MPTRIAPWIAAAAALALAAPAAGQQAGETAPAPEAEKAPSGVDVSAREDIEKGTYEPNKEYYDSIWFTLADEPEGHFLEALEAFQKDRRDEAAEHIRLGSTFLKMEATRPSEQAEGGADVEADPLMDAYRSLRFLAEHVEQGKVEDANLLDPHFAHAHEELARHHLDFARETWAPGESGTEKAAGRHLGGAVQHLQRGLTWAKTEPRRGNAPLAQAENVAKMLRGDLEGTASEAQVREALGAVEDDLVTLSAAITPAPAVSAAPEEEGEAP